MAVKVSEERFHQFINESLKYFRWDSILQEAGITEVSDKGDQFEIRCILHEDKRPSLRLNKVTGQYHCFSCGAKGTYTRFLWELSGKNVPYSTYCEQILKAHPQIQAKLKFTSLFVTEKSLDTAFQTRRIFNPKAHLGSGMPITSLASKVRGIDDTWENLVLSLTLLQQGITSEGVLTMVKKQHVDVKQVSERISLMDII